MNDLQVFNNPEFGQVRTVVKDGEPWFVAKDVCDALEILNPSDALKRLDYDERARFNLGRQGETNMVNEYGLYNLILGSRKPEAKTFKRWITHEVIPTIRKHGMYATPQTIETMLQDPDTMIRVLQELKAERQARLAAERTNAILMHVNKTYTTTEIAKELGFRSAAAFNRELAEKRIQYKQNNTWVLYSDYANLGYVDIKQEVLDNGKVIYHRRWTQRGREFLLNTYAYGGGKSDAV